ncbi:MAG: PfkB family carbohydrate kinase [Actinomycetes bacterium]
MIVVAGEALIDLIVDDNLDLKAVPGGGPFNAARTLGRLGADCTFLGVLADDHFGEILRSELATASVKLGCPTPTTAPTTLAVAQLSSDGAASYRFYLEGTSLPMLSSREAWAGLPAEFTAFHLGTLGIAVEPTASVLEALAEEVQASHIIMLDPNCRPAIVTDYAGYRARVMRLLLLADIVKVSAEDVAYLFPDGGFDEVVAQIVSGGGIVLHTAGAGVIDVFACEDHATVTPPSGGIVDTVGAGDTFGAAVLWALTEGGWTKGQSLGMDQLLPAVQIAAVAAHIECQRAGAEPPTLAELQARLKAD